MANAIIPWEVTCDCPSDSILFVDTGIQNSFFFMSLHLYKSIFVFKGLLLEGFEVNLNI